MTAKGSCAHTSAQLGLHVARGPSRAEAPEGLHPPRGPHHGWACRQTGNRVTRQLWGMATVHSPSLCKTGPQTGCERFFCFHPTNRKKIRTHGEACAGGTVHPAPRCQPTLELSITDTEPTTALGSRVTGTNDTHTPKCPAVAAGPRRHPTRVAAPGLRDCRRDVAPTRKPRRTPLPSKGPRAGASRRQRSVRTANQPDAGRGLLPSAS